RRRTGLTQEQAAQLKGCTVSAWRKVGVRRAAGGQPVRLDRDRENPARARPLQAHWAADRRTTRRALRTRDRAPIRGALHAYAPRLTETPDLGRLSEAVVDLGEQRHPGAVQRPHRGVDGGDHVAAGRRVRARRGGLPGLPGGELRGTGGERRPGVLEGVREVRGRHGRLWGCERVWATVLTGRTSCVRSRLRAR